MARLHIAVAQTGTSNWPRYFVRDNKGRYWTGTWWSDCPQDALLYLHEQEAANDAMVMNDCFEPRRFIATVCISVEHDESFSIEQLRELLGRSTVSLVLPDQHDMDNVDIEVRLDLSGMEEIE